MTRTRRLSYNATSNRLSSHTDTAGLPRSLSYDARGNVTALGGLGFTYDASNQPVAAYGAVTGTYVYDGHKRRVKQVVGGETRYSVYDVSGGLVGVDQVGAGHRGRRDARSGHDMAREQRRARGANTTSPAAHTTEHQSHLAPKHLLPPGDVEPQTVTGAEYGIRAGRIQRHPRCPAAAPIAERRERFHIRAALGRYSAQIRQARPSVSQGQARHNTRRRFRRPVRRRHTPNRTAAVARTQPTARGAKTAAPETAVTNRDQRLRSPGRLPSAQPIGRKAGQPQ